MRAGRIVGHSYFTHRLIIWKFSHATRVRIPHLAPRPKLPIQNRRRCSARFAV